MATLGEAIRQARELLAAGQFLQAETLYRQLLAAAPSESALWHEMGILQLQSDKAPAAVEFLERAATLDPTTAAYHSNLGTAYRAVGRTLDAVASLRRAVECHPTSAELLNNLALALKEAGQEQAALESFDEALRLRPDYANGHFNRGNLLLEMGRLEEAEASYRAALALNPRDAGMHCRLGVAYYDLGRMSEALASFDRALELQPNYPEVHRNRGLARLARGEYAAGWAEFEWRTECEDYVKHPAAQPRWEGSPLHGRTLLAHAEQGLGDTLQFVRYVPLVEQAGGRALLEAQSALRPLLIRSGFGHWLAPPDKDEPFDVHCPLMSLAAFLPAGDGRPFWQRPYLAADPALVEKWEARLRAIEGFRVGIIWAGNPGHAHDRFRSIRLAEFARLAEVSGVRLVSLQKGPGRAQLAELSGRLRIVDLGDELDETAGAFMDTAAVIRHLDLVVTIDTSVAHLAGGLGARVWLALHASPDWRWLTAGESTAWYPSMRLFRQSRLGYWQGAFAEMAGELRQLVRDG